MTTQENKIQEIRQGGLSLTSPSPTAMLHEMAHGADVDAAEIDRAVQEMPGKLAQLVENDLLMSGEGSIAGVILRSDQWNQYNDEIRARTQANGKTDAGDILLMHLLDEIQRLNQELADLRRDMAKMEAAFEAEFGTEWHEAFADMYLSDAEKDAFEGLEGAERDEAILQALKDKMLNGDGSIKDEYKDTKIAKYVQMHEREQQVSHKAEVLKHAVDSGDPELVQTTFQQVQKDQREATANQAVAQAGCSTIKGAFATAVSTESGEALAREAELVNADFDESLDASFDALFDM